MKANEKLRTPFTFLPFGGGPRICIGNHYAMLQILMILSHVLRKYDFELVPGQTIEERAMVILRPKNGIRMTFTKAVARHPLPQLQTERNPQIGGCPHNGAGQDLAESPALNQHA